MYLTNDMRKGFTLLEVLIYLAILALITTGAVRLLLSSSFNLAEARSERKIISTGENVMENMLREIRLSSSVVAGSSVFASNPGTLALTTLTSPGSGTETTKVFAISGGRITKQVGGGAAEFVTPIEAVVTDLTFWRSVSAHSDLVRIKITIEAGQGRSKETATFYGSAVLRRGY